MLAKCSNPSCFAPFLRLGIGRLYLLEADPPLHTDKFERTEYFWLCDACSATMTLRLTEDEKVAVVPLPKGIRKLPYGVSLVSRDPGKGLLLRSVSLLSKYFDDRPGTRWKARCQAA
jgi:hypothetical protein